METFNNVQIQRLTVLNEADINNIKLSGSQKISFLRLEPLSSAPVNLSAGLLVCADNENWDPNSVAGSNPYLTFYDGSAWNQVS